MIVQFIGCLSSMWNCRGAKREVWALGVKILLQLHECMVLEKR